jgi:DNA-binding CsgD family transcriptional regulator
MLETVREFALERLAASDEEASIQERHAAWSLTLAEAVGPRVEGPDAAGWLRQLAREWPNLRAAAGWALDRGDATLVLRLVAALLHAFNGFELGDSREARQWLDTALAMGEGVDLALRIDALGSASVLAAVEGDLAQAEALAEQSLALARGQGDREREADSLHRLGLAASFRGDLDRAEALFGQVLEARRRAGNTSLAGFVLSFLADAALGKGDIARAAALAGEARALWPKDGSQIGRARLMGTLGAISLAQGEVARAAQHYRDYLSPEDALGTARGLADALAGMAGVALAEDDPQAASRLLGAASALMDAAGARYMVHHVQYERTLVEARWRLPEPAFAAAWEAGRILGREEAVAAGLAVAAAAEAQEVPSKPAGEVPGLTPREREVLRLLSAGKSNPKIADLLFISPRTAQTHVTSILAKLGVASRAEAAAVAVRDGLV